MEYKSKTTVTVTRPGGGPPRKTSGDASLSSFYHERSAVGEILPSSTRPQQRLGSTSRLWRKMTIRPRVSDEPMTVGDKQTVEGILATLVARAFAADHLNLFRGPNKATDGGDEESPKPSYSNASSHPTEVKSKRQPQKGSR